MALFSHQKRLSQNEFSERERESNMFFFLRSNEWIFRNFNPANVGKSLLDGNRDHLLKQARSELMKHEHQVGSLNNCICKLQQHACAQRLELEDAHHGYVESRREQYFAYE